MHCRTKISSYLLMIAGSLLFALGFNLFLRPAGIVPGGLTSIALLINYLIPIIPIGLFTLLLNLPLFFLGLKKLGGSFVRNTIFTTIILSFFLDFFTLFPLLKIEPLLASIYGGVFVGAGMGLAFLPNSSTGGLDIAIRILRKRYPQLSIGQIMLFLDAFVVLAAAFIYRNLNNALYAIITMYVASLVLDAILYGLNYAKAAFIITAQPDTVNAKLMEKLVRGTTLIPCLGGYSKQNLTLILCAIKRNQITALKEAVYLIDPNAFIIVSEAHEVLGYGFQRHSELSF